MATNSPSDPGFARSGPVNCPPRYLYQYASHAAWLEDHRRLSNGALAHHALGLALKHPVRQAVEGLLAVR